ASSGTLASAMMSRMANAFGVVDGPINASTLCSPISFLAFCTARVVSPPSSSWIYSTDASPTCAGSNAPVFFWGMPIAEVGPVAETISPILTCAEAEARPKASVRATISARTSIRGSPERSAREGSNAKPNAPSEQGRTRSYPLRGRVTGSPCPLKIVAAKMPGHIDHLSDEIEAGNTRCGHRFRRQLARIHSAKGDLGLVITQGPGGQHWPVVEPRRNLAQPLVVELAHRTRRLLRLAPLLRKPSGQTLRQHGVELRRRRSFFAEPLCSVDVRKQVDAQRLASVPIRGYLENGRPGQAAVGKQQILPEASAVARHGCLDRDARQVAVT